MGRMNPSGPGATVSANVDGELLEEFDEWWEADDDLSSRSEALREAMREKIGTPTTSVCPMIPPDDEQLRYAYTELCRAANRDGIVRPETAYKVCANGPRNLSKAEVKPLVLHKLQDRGYLRLRNDWYGNNRIKLNQWDNDHR